jgi:hypothetical protein
MAKKRKSNFWNINKPRSHVQTWEQKQTKQMKTHFKLMNNTEYLGSWDLMDDNGNIKNRTFKIIKVEKREVFDGNGKSENLPVLFLENSKPMILKPTNMKTIAKYLKSPFIEDWSGASVEITVKKIKAFGEMHDALRVQNATKTASQEAPTPQPQAPQPMTDKQFEAIKNLLNSDKKEEQEKGVRSYEIFLKPPYSMTEAQKTELSQIYNFLKA